MPSRCTFKYLLITEANVPYSYSDTFTSCEECMKQDLNSLILEGGRHGA